MLHVTRLTKRAAHVLAVAWVPAAQLFKASGPPVVGLTLAFIDFVPPSFLESGLSTGLLLLRLNALLCLNKRDPAAIRPEAARKEEEDRLRRVEADRARAIDRARRQGREPGTPGARGDTTKFLADLSCAPVLSYHFDAH